MPRKADSPSSGLWETGLINHADNDSLDEEATMVSLIQNEDTKYAEEDFIATQDREWLEESSEVRLLKVLLFHLTIYHLEKKL
ncbi:unnamed protein product [Brugia timori]|uniref:Ovule protein n=1 Tax=Brugia timori TaxID=42155 RepID=A0A0R3QAV3_9BILA|nr:unnamed protein product [Brugia timori]